MKDFWKRKIPLRLPCRLGLYAVICGFVFLFCVALQAGSVLNTLKNFIREPRLLLLNLFPIAVFLGALTLLLGNLFWAGSLTALIFPLLSLVNLIKIECRKDPLVPADFALLSEAVTATGEYRLDLHIPYLIFIVLSALVLLLFGFKFKGHAKRLWARFAAFAVLAALFAASMLTVYPSEALYKSVVQSVDGLSTSNVPAVFDETGFLYCFLHNYGLYDAQEPEGYSAEEAAAWAAGEKDPEPLPVDVIMVQCEAFSDIYDSPAFAYAPEDNPLFLYHQIANSEQAVSGRIVVSNYGAGTANTEFDILTGAATNLLNENSTSAFRLVHKNTPSLARLFDRAGYQTWFMHPGQRWFYNRESVYHYLGLPDQTFLDALEGRWSKKGYYISDDSFGLIVQDRYETQKAASDAPLFAFTVTIQNHQAYPWDKYPIRPPEAPIRGEVSAETTETLSVYAEGIRDSALMLDFLTEYFDRQDRPVLLVFWGDHLPALGRNFSVYREIGLSIGNEDDPSSALDTYSTPFVIWANSAYCERYDFAARKQALDLPAGGRISDVYLGELVCELAGLNGADPFWDFLGQARRALPVICRGRFELADGTVTETLSPAQQAVLDKLRKWGYYRIMDARVS